MNINLSSTDQELWTSLLLSIVSELESHSSWFLSRRGRVSEWIDVGVDGSDSDCDCSSLFILVTLVAMFGDIERESPCIGPNEPGSIWCWLDGMDTASIIRWTLFRIATPWENKYRLNSLLTVWHKDKRG